MGVMLESWRNLAEKRKERLQKATFFKAMRGEKRVFTKLARYYRYKQRVSKATKHYLLQSLAARVLGGWKEVCKSCHSPDFIPIRITHATAISRKGDQLLRKQSLHITLLNPSFP